MKYLLLIGAALTLAAAPMLRAQSLTITAPGYSDAKLFDASPGFTISGLSASPSGDIFYIETDSSFTTPANARLLKRSASDGYAAPSTLFDFGAPKFGSFVVFNDGKVYFGENSTGLIRSINPDGTGLDLLGTVAGNYDLTFSGSALYISHNPGGFTAQNKVTKFLLTGSIGDLSLDAGDLIIDTPVDYSGPVEFGPGGSLFYGASGAAMADLYRFTGAESDGSGPTLQLDAPHLYLANGTNAYLAFDGANSLWHSNYSTLNLINGFSSSSQAIASTLGSINHLDFAGGSLFVNVTKSSFDASSVYKVVPEPTSSLLLLGALSVFTRRRR